MEIKKLEEAGSIFEIQIPEYKQIELCRKEAKLLKILWDFIYMIHGIFENWKKTLWREINGEAMETDCKKLYKELRLFDKETREWNTYSGVESEIKNMMISLRAVIELQNPAIRERHWQELMKATGVKFVITEKTTFSSMLTLNLHKFEDEVSLVKRILNCTIRSLFSEMLCFKQLPFILQTGEWKSIELLSHSIQLFLLSIFDNLRRIKFDLKIRPNFSKSYLVNIIVLLNRSSRVTSKKMFLNDLKGEFY